MSDKDRIDKAIEAMMQREIDNAFMGACTSTNVDPPKPLDANRRGIRAVPVVAMYRPNLSDIPF